VNLHKVMGRLARCCAASADGHPEAGGARRAGPSAHEVGHAADRHHPDHRTDGHGKSTTLAALLQWMNENPARHIVTIEDPVEYFTNQTCLFTQREVGRDTDTFGARAAQRDLPHGRM